jgi:hypothetical protein
MDGALLKRGEHEPQCSASGTLAAAKFLSIPNILRGVYKAAAVAKLGL